MTQADSFVGRLPLGILAAVNLNPSIPLWHNAKLSPAACANHDLATQVFFAG